MEQQKINVEDLPETIQAVGLGMNRQIFINEEYLDPAPSQEIYNHSPDGFNWGYGGSGPSQLALAICARFLGREEAEKVYQTFKSHVIQHLPEGNFRVDIAFRYWYRSVVEGLTVVYGREQGSPYFTVLPFELEDSGMNVVNNLTFTPAPEEITGKKRPDNPLL